MAAPPSGGVPFRKRIAKACDQCRRRKTKCDGELSCKSCRVTGLECSYGQSIKQVQGARYVAYLEQMLQKSGKQIRGAASADYTDEGETQALVDGRRSVDSRRSDNEHVDSSTSAFSSKHDWRESRGFVGADKSKKHADDDVVETIDCPPDDERPCGEVAVARYRGYSTGIEIVRNLLRLCDSFMGFTLNVEPSATKLANALDRSFPLHYLSPDSMVHIALPSVAQVRRWIDLAFAKAFSLWPFIDRQLFDVNVKRLLGQQNFGRERADRDNLALTYAVLALGQRYDPELMDAGGDSFQSGKVRGIEYFSAARDMIGLTECSRSVTAVQVVCCMALYLNSVSAQRMVHTYVSMGAYASHQLGLHTAATAYHLPESERVIRTRVYTTLRVFDAYVTSCLGLPRNLRAIEPSEDTAMAPYIDDYEMLIAADANAEVLEILGTAVEKSYMKPRNSNNSGSHGILYDHIRDIDRQLEKWAQKYPAFAQIDDNNLLACTKPQLLLRYSKCFVLLMLYCPFMHHVAKQFQNRNSNAYACVSKCIEAALQTVRTAEVLDMRGMFEEAWPLTVDVLAIAATSLLVVELRGSDNGRVEIIMRTSWNAKFLLTKLAQNNSTAAECLESLSPLYQLLCPVTAVSHVVQDFTLFTTENSHFPALAFDFKLDLFNSSMFMESAPSDPIETFTYPTTWPFQDPMGIPYQSSS